MGCEADPGPRPASWKHLEKPSRWLRGQHLPIIITCSAQAYHHYLLATGLSPILAQTMPSTITAYQMRLAHQTACPRYLPI